MKEGRRPVLAVIGNAGTIPEEIHRVAYDVGHLAVDAGFRLVTGGLDGVMAAASEGARSSSSWVEGRIVGVLPGREAAHANPWVDVVVPTGMGIGRNVIVAAAADVVVAVRGGSGTLSEMAYAWQLGKPVVALAPTGGWAAELAGKRIDARRTDAVLVAETAADAVALAVSHAMPQRSEGS